jgi:Leucine-rich repeat (LRR) protein
MKKKYLFAFLSMILLSFAVLSCSKGDDDGGEPGGGNGNPPAGDLKAGQIQIKGYANSSSKKIIFYATAKKLTVDWGDGQKEEITPNGVGREFPHEYENATNFQTISINTEELTEIGFGNNYGDIRELRFGNCPKLKEIDGIYYLDNLTVFEINRAESLESLRISRTDLTELNLNGCTNLTWLYCSDNQLTSLDVSKCTKLEKLNCGDYTTSIPNSNWSSNPLTSLDVSKCTNLVELKCYGNQLTSLDVSKCTKLTTLDCSYNQLSTTALNSLFTGLPVRTAADDAVIVCRENPGFESCNTSIAINKGWYVGYFI